MIPTHRAKPASHYSMWWPQWNRLHMVGFMESMY